MQGKVNIPFVQLLQTSAVQLATLASVVKSTSAINAENVQATRDLNCPILLAVAVHFAPATHSKPQLAHKHVASL